MGESLRGRQRELALLEAFLGRSAVEGGALLLTGEPGMGKTALLQKAADRAEQDGSRVFRTAGSAVESISFSALAPIAMPLIPDDDVLSAAHREALFVALGLADGRPPRPATVSQAVLTLLRTASHSGPVLVVVDDLQWLDPFSAEVLRFAARRVSGSRVGLLAASRTPAGGLGGAPSHNLAALDREGAKALLAERFPALAPRVRQRLLDEARGNPLALLELPIALSSRQLALQDLPAVLPLSDRLQGIFAARITLLPQATQDLLLLAALDSTGDLRVLSAAAADPVVDGLAPAERAGIIRIDDENHRLAFRHPLTRSAVAGLSTAASRRPAHQSLARALSGHPEQRARHLSASTDRPDEGVAAQLEQCARHMAHRGNAAGAITALTQAADLSPAPDDCGRRLAEAAYISSDLTWQLPQGMTPPGTGPGTAGALHLAAATAATAVINGTRDMNTIHRHLVTEIDTHTGTGGSSEEGLIAAATQLVTMTMFAERPELWTPCRAVLDRLGPRLPQALRLQAALQGDPVREALPLLPELDAAIASLHAETDPDVLLRIPAAATYVDRLPACRDVIRRQASGPPEATASTRRILAQLYLSLDAFGAGTWEEARLTAQQCLAACGRAEGRSFAQVAKYHIALLAAATGDAATTTAMARELKSWGTARGARLVRSLARHAEALAAAGRGDFDAAYRDAAAISPPGTFAPHAPTALWVCLELVEGAVATGRHEAARAHADAMLRYRLPEFSPRLALVSYGCAAMASGDDEEAIRLFERALSVPQADCWPFDHARVRLAYGRRLRRASCRPESRAQSQAALATFETLDARPWAARAARELRAAAPGGRMPTAGRDLTGPGALTRHELEIAQLAAGGHTNKQIGERLHLSPRTVSTHLYRIFPKLGITSRAALRDALTGEPPSGDAR
ncbi:AAA family ATPase [Streptomyces sp. SID8381]|uniref:helix-turn-helix transcriptional regulator n=1 Tax=unclassified Streptomyces TaxID=2593676 RepID=UPI0003756020|nr:MULTISPECIES: LuxR family transcriptional regulator [unclassified Streptomyces]MYX28838.1 AAA family ATPase [Streptomyces sp. SID8381]